MNKKISAILNLLEDKQALSLLTDRRPIATLPFGGRYRIIDFPFSSMHHAQVNSAALFLSGSGHSLYDHIRSGAQWGLDSLVGGGVFTHSQIQTTMDGPDRNAYYYDHRNFVDRSNSEYVLLLGSRMIANLNYRTLIEQLNYASADVGVVYKVMQRKHFTKETGAMTLLLDDYKVQQISPLIEVEDKEAEVPVSLDTIVLKKEKFFEYLDVVEKEEKPVSTVEFLRAALAKGDLVTGCEHNGYVRSIETMSDYFEANMDMLDQDNYDSLYNRTQPVITKVKNGAPTYYGEKADVRNVQAASDCVIEGKVRNSLIFRRTHIALDAEVSESIVTYGVEIQENVKLKYAILDKNVVVEQGVQLIGTRENPIVIEKNSVVKESIQRDRE